MKLRFLKWHPEGYQPEGYAWENYRRWVVNSVIKHDLYHHQLGESGTEEEELRALGAYECLEQKTYNMISNNLKFRFSKSLDKESTEYFSFSGIDYSKYSKLVNEVKQSYLNNPEYFLVKLVEGWEHAKTHNRSGYAKFKFLNFEVTHREGLDVTVDLDKGEITNTEVSKNFQDVVEKRKRALSAMTALVQSKMTSTKIVDRVATELYLENGGI